MKRRAITLVVAFILGCWVGPALAQFADRHNTPECSDALIALRADPSAAELRNRAAQRCLGGNPDLVPRRGRMVQPPIAVRTIPAAPLAATPPSLPTLIAPPSAAPTSVTSCDASGCWANDGSRLQLFDRYLIGPRGLCTVQGTALSCPP
jgi:hypothetical protein